MREKSQRRQTVEEKSPDSENFHDRIAPIDPIADDESPPVLLTSRFGALRPILRHPARQPSIANGSGLRHDPRLQEAFLISY